MWARGIVSTGAAKGGCQIGERDMERRRAAQTGTRSAARRAKTKYASFLRFPLASAQCSTASCDAPAFAICCRFLPALLTAIRAAARSIRAARAACSLDANTGVSAGGFAVAGGIAATEVGSAE